MPKLSVIIPVYNTLEYLKACLTSVLHQHFYDLEVIVVNDGSSDDSDVLLEYYHKNYPNITLISQSNHGLSHSRNVGLEKASGEYILFLDSDDAFIPNSLDGLVKYLDQKQPDVCIMNWMSYHKGRKLEYYEYFAAKKLSTIEDANGRDFVYQTLKKDKYWELYPWNMAYKRSYLEEHQFRFKVDTYFEDMIFNWQVLLSAKLVTYYSYHVVLYTRKREGQITRQLNLKSVLNRAQVSNFWLEHVNDYDFSPNERYLFLLRISSLYMSSVILVGGLKPEEQELVFTELEKGKEYLKFAPNVFVQAGHDIVKRLGFRRIAKMIGKKSELLFKF